MSFSHLPKDLENILILLEEQKIPLSEDTIEVLLKQKTNKILNLHSPKKELQFLINKRYIFNTTDSKFSLDEKGKIYLTNLKYEVIRSKQDKEALDIAKDANKISKKALIKSDISNIIAFVALVIAAIALFKK